jgi:hypothetical protein
MSGVMCWLLVLNQARCRDTMLSDTSLAVGIKYFVRSGPGSLKSAQQTKSLWSAVASGADIVKRAAIIGLAD